ncbi:MAG TPA: peptidoglycan-binding protein LysM [Albitalea sp.]|jgi:nucleoid-associated protein YgaU|nr:peptidoglycan-binding protein LysM [Albitalea sp.]
MSIVSFLKEAGEKLFGGKNAQAAPASSAGPTVAENVAALNAQASQAITAYVESQGLKVTGLNVTYDGGTQTVTVRGEAPDQATREKVVLCCGNVQAVAAVKDEMTVAQGGETSKFHTVKSGDTLSKIAKEAYGDANAYNRIFEANKPMLKHPDKIYPGQVLRIPPAG